MKLSYKGFTLAELLITLTIISVMFVTLISGYQRISINNNKMLFKKAYNTTEKIVSIIIQDDADQSNDNDTRYNTQIFVPNFSDTSEKIYKGFTISGNQKFCNAFILNINNQNNEIVPDNELSKLDDQFCTARVFTNNQEQDLDNLSAITPDGIFWILPVSNFENSNNDNNYIYIDINGNNRPNCFHDENSCKNPDRFSIWVEPNGRLILENEKEQEYLYNRGIRR